jgi:hypothetical protein
MPEWWTYSLSDFLMFSPRTYYRLLELYNAAIWPAQLLAIALGVAMLPLLRRGGVWPGRAVAAILSACWLWVAWAYLLVRYDTISLAGSYFALGFAAQALLIGITGVARGRLRFEASRSAAAAAGLCIFLYALAVHPLIGPLIGRSWLAAEAFGIAPDPTVVATLGILVAAHRPHWPLLVIPLLWCAVSGATLWAMRSPDALVLPAAALISVVLTGWKSRAGAQAQSAAR